MNLADDNLALLGGFSLLSASSLSSLNPDRARELISEAAGKNLQPFYSLRATATFNIAKLDDVRMVIPALKKMITELQDLEKNQAQLDREYVLYRQKDILTALILILCKSSNHALSEACLLILGWLTKATTTVDNTNFAPDTNFVNKPQVHSALMLDESADDLPPELDVDIRPVINGVEYMAMILDTGLSTNFLVRNRDWVENLNPDDTIELTTADPTKGKTITAGACQVRMVLPLQNDSSEAETSETVRLLVENCQLAPTCPSLFPTHLLMSNDFTVTLNPKCSYISVPSGMKIPLIHHRNKILVPFLPAHIYDSKYGNHSALAIPGASARPVQDLPKSLMEIPTADLWHYRLHRPKNEIQKLKSKTVNMHIQDTHICEGCTGDLRALPHKASERIKSTVVGALIYADLFGPYPFSSIGQSKYFVCYSDDASGYLATYFLKSQKSSEIVSSLNDFITHLGKGCIRRLRTDNAKYWHGDMRNFCQTHNIQQEFSPPYSHQSAGSAERAIGKITQLCRKLTATTNPPCEFWCYAIRHACLILNKTSDSPVKGKTPFEVVWGTKPNLNDIKVFGCLAIVRTPPERRQAKLLPNSANGIYLGRNLDSTSHIVFVPYISDLDTKLKGKLVSSKEVVFKEQTAGNVLLNPEMIPHVDESDLDRFWPISSDTTSVAGPSEPTAALEQLAPPHDELSTHEHIHDHRAITTEPPIVMATRVPDITEFDEEDDEPLSNAPPSTLEEMASEVQSMHSERNTQIRDNAPVGIIPRQSQAEMAETDTNSRMRRSRRLPSQTQFFDPATNLNDTAIRAARSLETPIDTEIRTARAAGNPLFVTPSESELPDIEDLDHSALHVRRIDKLQHPGVARELAAWRESMTIKQAKYQTRHFNPYSYSFATFASGGCLDSLGAIKVGLNPLFGCEVVPVQRKMWEDLTETPNYGDVFTTDFTDKPSPDILLSGMPCEDYSSLGSLRGSTGSTGHLFVKQAEPILQLQPSAAILEMTSNVVHFKQELNSLMSKLRDHYYIHQSLIPCWTLGDVSNRVRFFIVLLHRKLGPEAENYVFPPPIYDESRHPCGLDIALADADVPKKYKLRGEPIKYYSFGQPKPGTLHLVARFGAGVGQPDWPHKCHSHYSLPSTQLTSNGNSRRVMLSWIPGQPIKQTRLTAPVETVRMASLPQSYLSWARSFVKDDGFLHQCVNAGVPLRTGTALVKSVVDILTHCGAKPYSPDLNTLAVAASMLPTLDDSGGDGRSRDSGGTKDTTYTESEITTQSETTTQNATEFVSHDHFCLEVHQEQIADLVSSEPRNFKEVLHSPDKELWVEAINKEINSIINDKKAATFVYKNQLPRNAKLLPSKLVLKFKPSTAVSPAKYKARLVCGGHRQTAEDYDDIFSPVVRFTTIRALLALTTLHNWHTAQFDVECAFLNAPLKEEAYIRIPDGCTK